MIKFVVGGIAYGTIPPIVDSAGVALTPTSVVAKTYKNGSILATGDSVTILTYPDADGLYGWSYNPAGESEFDTWIIQIEVVISGVSYYHTDLIQAIVPERGTDSAASQSSVDNLISSLEGLGIVQASSVGGIGNDATHINLAGLTYTNDGIVDLQITILDDATGLKHSRWIIDWDLSTELAAVDLLPFIPDVSDTYWISAIRRNVDATKIGNSETAANNISTASEAMIRFTVSGSPTPTATSIPTSACDIAGVDVNQFRGMIMKFDKNTTTPGLRGQTTDIIDSTASATPEFTVIALTTAPVAGDTGTIL